MGCSAASARNSHNTCRIRDYLGICIRGQTQPTQATRNETLFLNVRVFNGTSGTLSPTSSVLVKGDRFERTFDHLEASPRRISQWSTAEACVDVIVIGHFPESGVLFHYQSVVDLACPLSTNPVFYAIIGKSTTELRRTRP
jgi:hypothetical protein